MDSQLRRKDLAELQFSYGLVDNNRGRHFAVRHVVQRCPQFRPVNVGT
jgi:hypothetical protein